MNDLALSGGHDFSRAVKAQSMRALAPAVPVLASWLAVSGVEGSCAFSTRADPQQSCVLCEGCFILALPCHPERSEGPMYFGWELGALDETTI